MLNRLKLMTLLLREGDAVLHDLIPDTDQLRKVALGIGSDLDLHRKHAFCRLDGFLMAQLYHRRQGLSSRAVCC